MLRGTLCSDNSIPPRICTTTAKREVGQGCAASDLYKNRGRVNFAATCDGADGAKEIQPSYARVSHGLAWNLCITFRVGYNATL